MSITNVRAPFLEPPLGEGEKPRCVISPYEARITLDYCNKRPKGISKDVLALVRKDMSAILAAFNAGEIVHIPHIESDAYTERKHGVAEVLGKQTAEELQMPVYKEDGKDRKKLPKPEKALFQEISEMDFEALKQDLPEGTIEPAMTGVLFPCAELRLPYTHGFYTGASYRQLERSPRIPAQQITREGKITEVFDPTTTTMAAVPWGMDIRSVSGTIHAVSSPSGSDPLVWRVQNSAKGMRYALGAIPNPTLPKVDMNAVAVSEAEQHYWREAMPLPPDLQAHIDGQKDALSHRDIAHLLLSCMGFKNTETGLTNFVYACHPRLGQFYKENADDLPLLMNELKAGHCDLLSWWYAAQMRAQGIPAWSIPNRVTTRDGKAFNKAYNHATVPFAEKDGFVLVADPTRVCDIDDAFHPSVLSDADVSDVEDALLKQRTTPEKAQVLRTFVQETLPTIRVRATDPTTQKDIGRDRDAMLQGAFSSLLQDNPAFENKALMLRADVADWNSVPSEISAETLQNVVSRLGTGGSMDLRELNPIARIEAKHKRVLFSWFLQACQAHRTPLSNMQLQEDMQSVFHLKEPISRADLKSAYRSSQQDLCSIVESQPERIRASDFEGVFERAQEEMTSFSFDTPYMRFMQDVQPNCQYSQDMITRIQKGHLPYSLSRDYLEDWLVPSRKSFAEKNRLSLSKIATLVTDIWHLARDLQYACLDDTYREKLLEVLGIGMPEFRTILKTLVGHTRILSNERRTIMPFKTINPYVQEHQDTVQHMLYLHKEDVHRMQRNFMQVVRRLSSRSFPSVKWEPEDTRRYVPGDDFRKVDWNAYARLNELFTKSAPGRSRSPHEELVVYFSPEFQITDGNGIVHRLQLPEIVRMLQQHARNTACTVYLTTQGGAWHALPQRESPQKILTSMISDMTFQYTVQPFVLPQNLLVLSNSFGECVAMEYLYGRQCNMATVYLQDPPFRVFPLAREKWVEKGLPDTLKAATEKKYSQ